MTASEQAAAKGGPITRVPVALGGEGIVYNLSLPGGAPPGRPRSAPARPWPGRPAKAPKATAGWPPGGIGLPSFLSDVGHEVPTSLLPTFLTSTLKAPASALG
jgi:hypothetical protein